MDNTLLLMFGAHDTCYFKILSNWHNVGIGIALDWDAEEWELSIHIGCMQIWIGGRAQEI